MNTSLRRRLFVWLSGSILAAGFLAAAVSFWLSYEDANELQDTQLQQVAAVLSNGTLAPITTRFEPRTNEEAETHFVVKLLGPAPTVTNPAVDLPLPESLQPGLQTLEQAGVRWRAIVTRSAAGQRFAVAQRMTVRDEVARDTALLTLLPLLVLMPILLLIVSLVLRQTFAPMLAMSAEVDRLDGSHPTVLDEHPVPVEALPLVQAVNRLMRRLALLLEQQRRLVSDAAHELRTPVAALIVQADNVQHVLPPEARERMSALRRGLARMSSLIDQLLDFARVQGAAPSMLQRLELNTLVRSAIEDIVPMAQRKGVDLGCVRSDPASIQGDPLHVYALVRNAVDNAVRYTPGGGVVDISVYTEGNQACLVVEDTGPGIAPTDMERAFEPFARLLGGQEAGSGLGLAIARTASQALGGRIELGERADHRSGLRFTYRQASA